MSKKKKTIEDLLGEALVPEDEQPFEVPENWQWTRLGSVFEQEKEQIQPIGNEKYIALENLKKGGGILEIGNSAGVKSKKVIFKTNDVLYGKLRPYLNKHALVNFEGVASTDILVYRNENIFINKLLNMYLDLPYVLQYTNENSNGINLPRVSPKSMEVLPFPLPPIKEQKRITEKIDYLLNKIKEAKRLIEEAKETFEIRRAAILDKAFRGELTRKWREENSSEIFTSGEKGPYQLPKEWQWTTIGEITSFVGSGSTPKGGSEVYQKKGIPFIRSQNVLRNEMSIDDIVYITEEIHSNMKRTHMHGNETLLNITGASIGRATKLKKELVPCNINQHVCALRFIAEINEELPQYWLNSWFLQKEINELQIGATRQALNFPQVKSLPFPLIPQEEQKEILRIMNDLLAKENKLAILGDMDREIDTLKQSILSKAFQGELGTNNPNEENSIELLKEILQKQVK